MSIWWGVAALCVAGLAVMGVFYLSIEAPARIEPSDNARFILLVDRGADPHAFHDYKDEADCLRVKRYVEHQGAHAICVPLFLDKPHSH